MCDPRYNTIFIYVSTVLFAIGGVITFSFGGLSLLAFCHKKVINDGCPTAFKMAVPVLIFIVSILLAVFLTIIGCIAACRSNIMLMQAFRILAAIIIAMQLSLTIWLLVVGYKESTKNNIHKYLTEIFEKNNTVNVANIQQQFVCCGLKDSNFWGDNLPDSCFVGKKRSEKFTFGCFKTVPTFIQGAALIIAIVFIVDIIIEVFAFLSATFIIKDLDDDDSDSED